MTKEIRTERRWLRSVIAASAEPLPAFPWMRGQRKRSGAMAQDTTAPAEPAPQQHHFLLFGRKGSLAAH